MPTLSETVCCLATLRCSNAAFLLGGQAVGWEGPTSESGMRDITRRGTEKQKKMKKDTERRKRDRERKRQEKKRKENSLTSLRQDEGSQEAEKGDLLIPGAPLLRDRLCMGTELPKAHSLWPAMLRRAC